MVIRLQFRIEEKLKVLPKPAYALRFVPRSLSLTFGICIHLFYPWRICAAWEFPDRVPTGSPHEVPSPLACFARLSPQSRHWKSSPADPGNGRNIQLSDLPRAQSQFHKRIVSWPVIYLFPNSFSTRLMSAGTSTPTLSYCTWTTAMFIPCSSARNCSSFSASSSGDTGYFTSRSNVSRR